MSKKKNKKSLSPRVTALPNKVITFIKEAKDELKKVTWPTRQITVRYTIIVIIASVTVGFVIGGMDFLLQKGLALII